MQARKAEFAGHIRVVPITRFSYTPWVWAEQGRLGGRGGMVLVGA
jgi:hypothetical protein